MVSGLANHRRIEIVRLLQRHTSLCVDEVAALCKVSQPTAVEHVRRLHFKAVEHVWLQFVIENMHGGAPRLAYQTIVSDSVTGSQRSKFVRLFLQNMSTCPDVQS